jgi:hypothetical protein
VTILEPRWRWCSRPYSMLLGGVKSIQISGAMIKYILLAFSILWSMEMSYWTILHPFRVRVCNHHSALRL